MGKGEVRFFHGWIFNQSTKKHNLIQLKQEIYLAVSQILIGKLTEQMLQIDRQESKIIDNIYMDRWIGRIDRYIDRQKDRKRVKWKKKFISCTVYRSSSKSLWIITSAQRNKISDIKHKTKKQHQGSAAALQPAVSLRNQHFTIF